MDKLKIYGSLLLCLLSVFLLGSYTEATFFDTREIETHRWVLTSLVGLMFLSTFLQEYKK